jgi:O-antigen/teichoic acid export membrane protein
MRECPLARFIVQRQAEHPLNTRLASFLRYGLAASAPGVAAAAQFVLQLALLRAVDAAAFGQFAFALGLVQFGFGLSNALIATPYTVIVNGSAFEPGQAPSFFMMNLLFATAWAAICGGTIAVLGAPHEAWLFGLFAFLAMIRWFGRAHLYALHRPIQAAGSDLVYSLVLVIALGAAWLVGLSLATGVATLVFATIGGMAALGSGFITRQFLEAWAGKPSHYGPVWQEQSRWTLLGVVSSEATANAHAYAVTLVAGPAAFAPIAAATLFVKPVALAITSLTQLERPTMARYFSAGDFAAAFRSVRRFRGAALLAWSATVAIGLVVVARYPQFVFKASYDAEALSIALGLWALISLLQCWSMPSSVLLQAASWFQPLARWGVICAILAIVAVLALVLLVAPIYSLLGIVLGQIATSISIAVLEARLKRNHTAAISQEVSFATTEPVL